MPYSEASSLGPRSFDKIICEELVFGKLVFDELVQHQCIRSIIFENPK